MLSYCTALEWVFLLESFQQRGVTPSRDLIVCQDFSETNQIAVSGDFTQVLLEKYKGEPNDGVNYNSDYKGTLLVFMYLFVWVINCNMKLEAKGGSFISSFQIV